jgi:HAD superfamily hydrolase (TIGR01509 family)
VRHFAAVIFDMDGLLLDTERVALESFNEACASFGLPDHPDVFRQCVGVNGVRAREVIREGLGHAVAPEEFWTAWDRFYHAAHAREPIRVKAGAEALLEQLSAWQMPMGVATSTRVAQATRKLTETGLAGYFSAIVGGDQVERSKPHPDIYLRVAHLLAAPPSACLALEDSENGVRAAVAAGMTVVQVPDLQLPSDDLRSLGHIVLESLEQVPGYPFQGLRANE